MLYQNSLDSYESKKKTAVTLGKFDGLHLGHQALLEKVKSYRSKDVDAVLFTFDMQKTTIQTQREQQQFLRDEIDIFIHSPFTPALRLMEAEAFIKEILHKRLQAAYIVVGEDFRFGHDKRGDIHMLDKFAQAYSYHIDVIEKVKHQGRIISSTYIREMLKSGELALANQLMGHVYEINGIVEKGKKLGRTLVFPTINVAPPTAQLTPKAGVYSVQVEIEEKTYQGICNLGIKPTVTDVAKLLAEVHVFDFENDVYGKTVKIKFLDFIRGEKKFNSLAELKAQVDQDIELVGKPS